MVSKSSKQSIYPRRGLLVHHSPLGCPPPADIAEGQSLQVNDDIAKLQCNPGHVIQSSLTPTITLRCSGAPNWQWTPAESHCVSLQFLMQYANTSVVKALSGNYMRLEQKEQRFITKCISAYT